MLIIVGPTAAGKSSAAVRLAVELGGEVISADSMQVYRGFDIGTGKLTLEQRRGVPHHLIDVVDPHQRYSAADFVRDADVAIAEVRGRGRLPIVVGGTGLYLRALTHGLFEAPAVDSAIRAEHQRVRRISGAEALFERLRRVDPATAQRVDRNDFVRISRALEVFEQTGVTISALREAHGFRSVRYAARWFGIQPCRAELRRRIEQRVDDMMVAGWLDELRSLNAAGLATCHAMGALGYRQLGAHLRGELDLAEAIRQTKRDTWRFARRQRNWFSSETGVVWVEDASLLDASMLRNVAEGGAGGFARP